jgi:sterol desaturase/sphingolipid hydroxylase (fatty acid hydroxylase superfamily)
MTNGTSAAAAPSMMMMDHDDLLSSPTADDDDEPLALTTVDWLTFVHGLKGMLYISCSYWTAVFLYMAIPRLFPDFAARYKLQRTPLSPQQRQLDEAPASPSSKGDHNNKQKNGFFFSPPNGHTRGVLLVLFNQVFVSSLFNLTVYQLRFWSGRSIPIHFPQGSTMLWHFGQYMVFFEFMFYWSHRLLHTKYLYRSIHSVHHKYKAPVPYCAACVHPIEFIMSYMAPNVLPAVLFGHSVAEVTLFVAFEAFHTVHDHCGYHYPYDPFTLLCQQNAAVHDEHHRLLKVNYSGAFTMIMDKWFGTYYEPKPLASDHDHDNQHHKSIYVWLRSFAVNVSRTLTTSARPLCRFILPLILGGQNTAAAGRATNHNNKEL